MEVNHTHQTLLGGQKALVPTTDKVHTGESFQKNGRLPPQQIHSVKPQLKEVC